MLQTSPFLLHASRFTNQFGLVFAGDGTDIVKHTFFEVRTVPAICGNDELCRKGLTEL